MLEGAVASQPRLIMQQGRGVGREGEEEKDEDEEAGNVLLSLDELLTGSLIRDAATRRLLLGKLLPHRDIFSACFIL